jgi:hypothetical protein
VSAPRVVFARGGRDGQGLQGARSHGARQLKALGAKHVAIGLAGAGV